jgi:hypothetical protein
MPVYPNTRIKWHELGLVPTTSMAFWHCYEAGVSGHDAVIDYSGNSRHLASSGVDPVLAANTVYGQPAWHFDGSTTAPLAWSGSVNVAHYFVLAAHDDAAFNLNRGLMSGVTSGDLLVSNNSGTAFYNLGLSNFTYRKGGTSYPQSNQQAPMSGGFQLIEVITSTGALNGIQVGRQRDIAGRIWDGWWADHMGFTAELSVEDRRRVLLYYSLRYGAHLDSEIPLFFPSSDLIEEGTAIRNRFYPVPRGWDDITEEYEFEDANKTFNEHGDDAPRRWEYRYVNVTKAQAQLFDVFQDTARRANTFYFKDPEGYIWDNVRVEEYDRNHDAHKRWVHTVDYRLVGYNSTASVEADEAAVGDANYLLGNGEQLLGDGEELYI